MDRHDKAKIDSYDKYKEHMRQESKKQRQFGQNYEVIKDHLKLVEENTEAIERMGA